MRWLDGITDSMDSCSKSPASRISICSCNSMIPWHLRRSLGSCLPSLAITLWGEDICSEFQILPRWCWIQFRLRGPSTSQSRKAFICE
ncbi:hypothetical protein CapIbe_021210 [Capra ibex]